MKLEPPIPSGKVDVLHPTAGARLILTEHAHIVEWPGGSAVVAEPALQEYIRSLFAFGRPGPGQSGMVRDDQTVELLVRSGIARRLPVPLDPSSSALWNGAGIETEQAAALVSQYALNVNGEGAEELVPFLKNWGWQDSAGSSHEILVASDPLAPGVAAFDKTARARWTLAVPAPDGVWTGQFRPDAPVCVECFQARIRQNRPAERLGRPVPQLDIQWTPSLLSLTAYALALECAAADTTGAWTHTGLNRARTVHPVLPLACCPTCTFTAPSTPTDWVSPVTGLVGSMRQLACIGGVHVWAGRHRQFLPVKTVTDLQRGYMAQSGGRGWTPEAAQASVVYEAIERASGVLQDGIRTLQATAQELGAAAILPNELDGFSASQRACPTPVGPLTPLRVPFPLHPDQKIEWVEAMPLSGQSARFVPAAAVFYGVPMGDRPYAFATSNGCAGGQTWNEALRNALMELIERDAIALWWYNAAERPRLDIERLGGARASRFEQALYEKGRQLAVFDLTTDLGVPVAAAVSKRSSGPHGWAIGFGAAASRRNALLGSLAELAQLLPATDHPKHPNPLDWADTAGPSMLPHLVFGPGDTKDDQEIDTHPDSLVARLQAAGLEAWAIDQTHPEVGTPVVRALVPGLVHFWRRLGARRLYEVPVQLGWRTEPITEQEVTHLDLTV